MAKKRTISRLVARSQLLTAVVLTVVVAVGVGVSAYLLMHQLLSIGSDPIQPKDLTQFALTIAAGIGGVVALVVAYRRQYGIEQGHFVERFGAAANQLGHSDAAVRLAGVYAMSAVADEVFLLQRQQCIDVLCGYLRLPYSPALGASHQSELEHKVLGGEGEERTHRFQYRQNDKEVRQTIVRVITAHLRRDASKSWSECSFDFQGAALEESDFGDATFSGSQTSFTRATFSGAQTSFTGATFNSAQTSFDGARFSAERTSFTGAAFNSAQTSFTEATFTAERTSFSGVTFNSAQTSFTGATFNSAQTSFDGATFCEERTWFNEATFNAKRTSFTGTTFSAERTSFTGATFSGALTSFTGATFNSARTSFTDGTFTGQETTFLNAKFSGGIVSFDNARKWDPSPRFDWNDDLPLVARKSKPHNVLPEDWPPSLRERSQPAS
jgi:hypothetical protein